MGSLVVPIGATVYLDANSSIYSGVRVLRKRPSAMLRHCSSEFCASVGVNLSVAHRLLLQTSPIHP